jgi:hypothetical protein
LSGRQSHAWKLEILRIVLAVLNLQTRHAAKGFRQVNARGAWRISSPLTTLTAAGVSSSDTVCGVALTIMVCSSAAIETAGAKITGTSSSGKVALRAEMIFMSKPVVEKTNQMEHVHTC